MSVEDDIRDLKTGQEKTREAILKFTAGQASLEGCVDTFNVKLQAHLESNAEAVKALFASRREHAKKIEDIRVDYVPKDDFDAHARQNRKEHTTLHAAVACVQWKVAKIVGGVTLLVVLAGLVIKGIGVFGNE